MRVGAWSRALSSDSQLAKGPTGSACDSRKRLDTALLSGPEVNQAVDTRVLE